jgi:hypothetical protein
LALRPLGGTIERRFIAQLGTDVPRNVRQLCPPPRQLVSLASRARTDVSVVTTRLPASVREVAEEATIFRLPWEAPSRVPTSVHLADSTLARCTETISRCGSDVIPGSASLGLPPAVILNSRWRQCARERRV